MADPPLELILDLSRAEDAADPFSFQCVPQEYRRHEDGRIWSAQLAWEPELLGDLAELARRTPDPARVQRLGDSLRRFLLGLGWEVEERRLLAAIEAKREIHLTCRFAAAELYSLPWELMTIEPTRQHVGELPSCLVRYEWPKTQTARPEPSPPPAGGRILLAWSMAGGSVGAPEHLRAVSDACAKAEYSFNPQRDVLNGISLEAFSDALAAVREPIAVLHLLCHGTRVGTSTYGLLWGTAEAPQPVDAGALRHVLAPHVGRIRLVILSACHSGDPGELGSHLGSVAQALHAVGIAAVVASRLPLTVKGSAEMTETLYAKLLAGSPLSQALEAARRRLAQGRPSLDWASLQLYARRAEPPSLWPIVFRPYRGLLSFEARHRRFLFGRKDLQRALVRRLREALEGTRPRFQIVAGASGSGKSSLVKAGLVPLLPRRTWESRVVRPGELDSSDVAHLRQPRARRRLLLVVDQFEEVFTRLSSLEMRQAFVRSLWELANSAQANAVVIITLRLDYFERCRELLLEDGGVRLDDVVLDDAYRMFVRPLQPPQLEEVIAGPARRAGLELETGLVERLRNDVEKEPGGLPLLEYALDQLWQRRAGNRLAHAEYNEIGGVPGALTRTADGRYERLSPIEQREARRLWVALVDFREDALPYVRRRVKRAQARPQSPEAQHAFDRVAEEFIAHRLLVGGAGEGGDLWLELAHEALLQSWQRLASWVQEDRERELQLRQLDAWAEEWRAHRPDKDGGASYLLSGDRLAYARSLKEKYPSDLSVEGEQLIATSWELSEAQRMNERRRQRNLRRLSRGLAVSLVLVIGFGGFALLQRAEAVHQAAEALHQLARVVQAQKLALARELALTARSKLEEDPQLSLALMVHTHRIAEREPASDADVLLAWQSQTRRAVFRDHWDAVLSAQFSPDGMRIVTASADHTARIWDAASSKPLAELRGHLASVATAQFSPDGSLVVTASEDHTARVWDTSTGKQLAQLRGHSGPILMAEFSRDGLRVVTASDDHSARVWDASTGTQLVQLRGHSSSVSTAHFSPDGQRVLTASDDRTVRLWSASRGMQLMKIRGRAFSVRTALFSPDGRHIVTAGEDNTALVWDASTGKLLAELRGHSDAVLTAQFSPDGRNVVTASDDHTARVWRAASGQLLAVLRGHSKAVLSAQFSPDGRRVITASADHTARVWDTTGMLAELRGHSDAVLAAQFSPDGRHIVTASADSTARVWSVTSGRPVAQLRGHSSWVEAAEFSPDGQRVVTASADATARVWDAFTGRPLPELRGHTASVAMAQFSPDGRRIVTASADATARIWDASTGGPLLKLRGHAKSVWTARFSPDGGRVVTASADGTARVWDAASGALLALLLGHSAPISMAEFSPDGRKIVTASFDHTACVWSATTGQPVAQLRGHSYLVRMAQFSPDGLRVVTASDDHTARVWDALSGKLLAELLGHSKAVWTAQFSPDGRRIVTAGADNTTRVWDISTRRELARFLGQSYSAQFSPDGLRVVTTTDDNTAHVWEADTGKQLAEFRGHSALIRTAKFSPEGLRVLTASDDSTARVWACELCTPPDAIFLRWSRELTCEERRTYLHEDIFWPRPEGR